MRAVLQRVAGANVIVNDLVAGAIGKGLLVYVGIGKDDSEADVYWLYDKLANLRMFPDQNGLMNKSLKSEGGAVLVVSQFTLYADVGKGRRPSFSSAAGSEKAKVLYDLLVDTLTAQGISVATGVFQENMRITCINEGPITILLDSKVKA